jgi:hypothetical protein
VQTGGAIDVSGRGYPGGTGGQRGGTLPGLLGASGAAGGSYGGWGGFGAAPELSTEPYGDYRNPNELGSGGGGACAGAGGAGGGVIRIAARTVTLDGRLSAAGGTASRGCGAGSGGGITRDRRDSAGAVMGVRPRRERDRQSALRTSCTGLLDFGGTPWLRECK